MERQYLNQRLMIKIEPLDEELLRPPSGTVYTINGKLSPPPELQPEVEELASQVEPSSEINQVPPSQPIISPHNFETPSSLPGASKEDTPSSASSNLGDSTNKQHLDYDSMSTGAYLDSTVVPILHVALVHLDRLRPEDPVQFVIDFLLRNKGQYSKSKEQPSSTTIA